MRTEMGQSLVQSLNCGTAELQNKEYSVCGIRTAKLKVTAYSLCGSGTVELQVIEYFVCGSGTSSHIIFCVWNISGSLCNGPNDTRAQGQRVPGSKPSWRCCYLLFHLGGGPYWDFCVCFLRYYEAVTTQLTYDKDPDIRLASWPKAAGTKLPTGSTRQSKGEFTTL